MSYFQIVLSCEGIGDCLFAIPVIRKLKNFVFRQKVLVFTHHPDLFKKCPYVVDTKPLHEFHNDPMIPTFRLFDLSQKTKHWMIDTIDFISISLGIGQLSFREKKLEYFPVEDDHAEAFDVVLNTSQTWPSRSWSVENWQKLADHLLGQGLSVAVIGKDVESKADQMAKRSPKLTGCINLINQLSLDQTYYTIQKAGLFITCQNGLSVLAGATQTEVVILDMSIEWSKRPMYRHESPDYKVTYVKGTCDIYCCSSFSCEKFGNSDVFRMIKKSYQL